jgi:DNA primase
VAFVAENDQKELVRQAIDIVDLVGSYVPLRRAGRGYKALCPFHDDTTPSLQVNPERQSWKCWVCDVGGDIFSFVMQKENVDFREALEMLADRAGIQLLQSTPPSPGSAADKKTLFRAMAWAEELYHKCLLRDAAAEPARKYLAERGISAETIAGFRVGFVPNEWRWLLSKAEQTAFSVAVLDAVGLCKRGEESGRTYDAFRGRVMFPIHDLQGRTIAFGGRILPEYSDANAAKYINSPETPLFSKSNELYALLAARDAITKSKHAVVMEGYTDVLMAHQHGLASAVAVLGTALGERHVRLLRRYADAVTLVLDGDEAGQRRTNEVLELFIAQQLNLRILTLPSEHDPCSFLQLRGLEEFSTMLAAAPDAFEHKLNTLTRGLSSDVGTHAENTALEEMLATIAKAPRLQRADQGATRLREQQLLARLARRFRVSEEELRRRLTNLRRGASAPPATEGDGESRQPPRVKLASAERELLEILLQNPSLAAQAAQAISPGQLTSEVARSIYAKAIALVQAGAAPTFEKMILEFEQPAAKNLLVELDERGREKAATEKSATEKSATEKSATDAHARLADVIAYFQRQSQQRQTEVDRQRLEEGRVQGDEELDLLKQVIERERSRRGISDSMDG